MKILGRDPTLYLATIVALISFAGTLGYSLLSPDQAGLWIVVVNAVAGAIVAWTVRPIKPALFTYLIGALVALAAAYGFDLSEQVVNGLNGLVVPFLSLLTYGNVSPIETPLTKASENPVPEAARAIADPPT